MTDMPVNHQVGGWRHDRENQASILARSMKTYADWREALGVYEWDAPEEIDSRGWRRVENQAGQGACQGVALSSSAELCYLIGYGRRLQFSKNWAYYCSQDFDNINGDNGSTLDGGSKCAQQIGMVLEEDLPYTDNYSRGRSEYASKYDQLAEKAKDYRMMGEAPLSSYADIYNWLASGAGPVQIGILWGVPDAWEVTSYRAGGGGHSVNFTGYLQVQAWPQPGLILENSWSDAWGRDGFQLWHPDAVNAACRHQWNVFVGRSDSRSPKPRPKPDL